MFLLMIVVAVAVLVSIVVWQNIMNHDETIQSRIIHSTKPMYIKVHRINHATMCEMASNYNQSIPMILYTGEEIQLPSLDWKRLVFDVLILDGDVLGAKPTQLHGLYTYETWTEARAVLISAKGLERFREGATLESVLSYQYHSPHGSISSSHPEFILMVKTCKKYWKTDARQNRMEQKYELERQFGIPCYHYLGDESLTTDWMWDEHDRLLRVRTQDDYLNLCHKVGVMFQAVQDRLIHNRTWHAVKGALFCDDDVEMHNMARMVEVAEQNAQLELWGHVAKTPYRSTHFQQKAEECTWIQKTVEKFPTLGQYPIDSKQGTYCAGGFFYVRKDVIPKLLRESKLFRPFPSDDEELQSYIKGDKLVNLCAFDDVNIGIAAGNRGVKLTHVHLFDFIQW